MENFIYVTINRCFPFLFDNPPFFNHIFTCDEIIEKDNNSNNSDAYTVRADNAN